MRSGIVFICGAGPGDPKLMSVRAMELLKSCDLVLYDRLVSKEIIDQISIKSEKIDVGSGIRELSTRQDNINKLMVKYAKRGKRVLRLKGGDPFIFGRGAEEAEYLDKHNVKFEIIPGITSALGSAAYAGIPLTYRRFASSVIVVTGHEDPKKKEPMVRWKELAKAADTIVILMGISQLEQILYKLIDAGLRKDTKIAVIENATTKEQRIVKGNLNNIMNRVIKAKLKSPAVIIIGKVVSLQKKLNWFNK